MSLKTIQWFVIIAMSSLMVWGAPSGSIRGRVLDASGNGVAGAAVSITDLSTGVVMRTTTGPNGGFLVNGLAARRYQVTVKKTGFDTLKQPTDVQAGQEASIQATLRVKASVQSVEVHARLGTVPGATPQPTQQQVFQSNQTVRVLDRKQMDAAGPVAGAAQIISYTPGANVTGYGNTGATKYTVTLNGINQGWGGYGGFTGGGSLSVTFDGVPIVDPASELWQSPTIPQTNMIQNTTVTYGPGIPADRWYSNVGGGIEFTPVQPTAKLGGDVSLTYGSYNQKNIEFNLGTGLYHGWSAVIAGGYGSGDSFRQSPDGFANPSHDGAIFAKAVKTFQAGSFELGGYLSHSRGYRAQVIPGASNPLITLNGLPAGEVYSQQSSGFYSTLPYDSYNKDDSNNMSLLYGRENIRLDNSTALHNTTWFMRITRLHNRLNDVYNLGPQQNEWNNPYTNTIGDRLWLSKSLAFNTFDVGAYYIHALYNSRNNFYNPADGGGTSIVNIGGQIRSSYFAQDDYAVFAQDDIHPIPMLHITPGIRYVGFQAGYSNGALNDFTFAPGVILNSHCPSTLTSTPGNTNLQGASCDSFQARTGFEPSIDAALTPLPWLTFYGGYDAELRSPSLGGGGGLFQKVKPGTYHLARGGYTQGGFKVHFVQAGPLNNVILGAATYHLNFSAQEIDIGLANGNTISANGSSVYNGLNAFFDADPISDLHVFANLNGETAKYTNYVVDASGTNYNGVPVSYVPSTTLNLGAYYDVQRHDRTALEPRLWYQFTGSQHIFDNSIGAPSNQTMPSFGTLNLSINAPIKFLNLSVTMLNLMDKQYNEYEYISSGGYFGTPNGGYTLSYPAAPFTVYASVDFHF